MTDLRIAPKPTASDEMRQAAVEVLREALTKAEAGDVDACLVILRHPGGRWSDERMHSTTGRGGRSRTDGCSMTPVNCTADANG